MSRETTNTNRIDWSEAPFVFVEVPSCPHCGGYRWTRQKTISTPESVERLAVCVECGGPYRIVVEFPLAGIDSDAVSKIASVAFTQAPGATNGNAND